MNSEKATKDGFPIYVKLVHLKHRFKKCIGHSVSENWDADNNQPLRLHPQYIDFHLKYYGLSFDLNRLLSKIRKLKFHVFQIVF